jgi:subtilisin family serine protease
MNKKLFIIVIFLFIFGIFLVSSFNEDKKVDKKVYDAFEENNNVRIIIKLKEIKEEKGFIFKTQKSSEEIKLEKRGIKEKIIKDIGEENIKHVFDKTIASGINENKLNDLMKNDNIESIKIDRIMRAFLQDSVPLINASTVWPINILTQNITGINETICIIDSGINLSYHNLNSKIIAQKCYCSTKEGANSNCCEGNVAESNKAIDNNGHGTHVAGIAAASGTINGVATGANLIAIKTLNSSGDGLSSDIIAGIEWCSNNTNIENYNISIISMSLGGGQYSNYCDDSSSMTNVINIAIGKNISVIISTGNTNAAYPVATAGIADPSCIENATRVSATDKSDNVANYAFRHSNFSDILFAPGSSINSTVPTGSCELCDISGYDSLSGTSMAAPHVAGAFALFRQFFRLQNNRVPTPSEIKTTFNNTGKQINDSAGTGLNFTRIDVYAALISIDSSNPVVSLLSPLNATTQFTKNITFSCSANDVQLSNITLYVWNSSGIYNNSETETFSSINGQAEFNLTNIPYGVYEWNCLAYDHNSNSSFASSNYTLTIGQMETTLNSPSNNDFVNQNQTYNCSAETESTKKLTNITFQIYNSTNNLIYNLTNNFSGSSNSSIFYYNFTGEGNYSWNCLGYNNHSESDVSSNYTITYDTTKPNLTLISLPGSSTSNSISKTFSYNASDTNLANCSLVINNVISQTNNSINQSQTQNFIQTFTPGTYVWKINCTDLANNQNNSVSNSFTITAETITTSSGGGGGGTRYETYTPTVEESSGGYTKGLRRNEKIKFTFLNQEAKQHTLTLNNVGKDFINLTIQSDPIKLDLIVGQSVKMNVTSPDYYDLYIKLEDIQNNKAEITIQTIYEEISKTIIPGGNIGEGNITNTDVEENIVSLIFSNKKIKIILYLIITAITIFIIIITYILVKREKGIEKN